MAETQRVRRYGAMKLSFDGFPLVGSDGLRAHSGGVFRPQLDWFSIWVDLAQIDPNRPKSIFSTQLDWFSNRFTPFSSSRPVVLGLKTTGLDFHRFQISVFRWK